MKKNFIFVLLLLLVPAICLAEPQVTSDKQTFNPFTGVYDLQGNVHVEIGDRIITGDAAQVSMYKLEVHGQGNITLREGDITFDCDTVDVYGKEKTAVSYTHLAFIRISILSLRVIVSPYSFLEKFKIDNPFSNGCVPV